jgi:hypothetical protein
MYPAILPVRPEAISDSVDSSPAATKAATNLQEMTPMSYTIEEDHGTYTGTRHRHNGYYAGDFAPTQMRTPEQLAAIVRMRLPNLPGPRS